MSNWPTCPGRRMTRLRCALRCCAGAARGAAPSSGGSPAGGTAPCAGGRDMKMGGEAMEAAPALMTLWLMAVAILEWWRRRR